MWKSNNWAADLDLQPYQFIVSHYYTSMPKTSKADDLDESSLHILNSCVDRMLGLTNREAKALYVMLAAHYNEPRAITPAQMLTESNLLARKNVSVIGWFAFDSLETGLITRGGRTVTWDISRHTNTRSNPCTFLFTWKGRS